MKTHDAQNERIKRRYLIFLKEAKRFSESSLDGVAKAIHRFESYTKFRDFRQFHIQQAIAFKVDLANQRHARTKAPLSKATLASTPKRAQSVLPMACRATGLQISAPI